MIPAPDPALVERFRRDLEAITNSAPAPERKLGVAVSGGADSLALLLLAVATYPGAVEAATVDHGLRAEAAEEAAFVHRLCATLDVPHAVLRGDDGGKGSVQERARAMRYAALGGWAAAQKLTWVATAHQQDDVAESLLLRASRGAGVGGLAEMPRRRPLWRDIALVRPLLDWSRPVLAAIVADAGITPIADPSNGDPRYDRTRIRHLLADQTEMAPDRLALAARNLRHAEDALAWAAEREWRVRSVIEAKALSFDPTNLPYELRRRLAIRAIHAVRVGDDWRETGIDRLLATLDAGGIGTIAGVRASAKSGKWRFAMAPPRRSH